MTRKASLLDLETQVLMDIRKDIRLAFNKLQQINVTGRPAKSISNITKQRKLKDRASIHLKDAMRTLDQILTQSYHITEQEKIEETDIKEE